MRTSEALSFLWVIIRTRSNALILLLIRASLGQFHRSQFSTILPKFACTGETSTGAEHLSQDSKILSSIIVMTSDDTTMPALFKQRFDYCSEKARTLKPFRSAKALSEA